MGSPWRRLPIDTWAEDLAEHARQAAAGLEPEGAEAWRALEKRYVRRAAELVEQRFRYDAAARLWKRHAELSSGSEQGESFRRAAFCEQRRGSAAEAERLYEQALAIRRGEGGGILEGIALGGLGSLYRETGRLAQAAPYERALELVRASGDREVLANLLGRAARLASLTGRSAEAERAIQEELEIWRAVGNRRMEGHALGALGTEWSKQGRKREAEAAYDQALAILRSVGARAFEAGVLSNLSPEYLASGRLKEALEASELAVAIHREFGNRRRSETSRDSLGTQAATPNRPGSMKKRWPDPER